MTAFALLYRFRSFCTIKRGGLFFVWEEGRNEAESFIDMQEEI